MRNSGATALMIAGSTNSLVSRGQGVCGFLNGIKDCGNNFSQKETDTLRYRLYMLQKDEIPSIAQDNSRTMITEFSVLILSSILI